MWSATETETHDDKAQQSLSYNVKLSLSHVKANSSEHITKSVSIFFSPSFPSLDALPLNRTVSPFRDLNLACAHSLRRWWEGAAAVGTVGQSSGSVNSRSPPLNQSRSSFSSVAASPSRFSPSPQALLPSSYGTTNRLFPLSPLIPGSYFFLSFFLSSALH